MDATDSVRLEPEGEVRQPLSAEEFEALMDELAEGSDQERVPPVLTREDIYSDHD